MTKRKKKWRVKHQQIISYEVVNSYNLFHPQNPSLLSAGKGNGARRFVVVDHYVYEKYSEKIREYFHFNEVEAKIIPFRGGEDNKTVESYLSIVRELDAFPIHRRDEPILAIGGGVLTDTIGFVASTYRRGVPHIKIPTTLMGYIDASIGIKTGINFDEYKNRLGSFSPPKMVLLDRSLLGTLPRRHILNGVCEIIKLAIIKDLQLFQMLEADGAYSVDTFFQDERGGAILDRAITGMLEELEPNLFEEELARKVDFGHTFSYGLETHHEAHLLHGEAVLLDIVLSVLIAKNRNLISNEETGRIFQLLASLGIVLNTSVLDPQTLWESLEERTYHRNRQQRVPLPNGLGECVFVNDICRDEVELSLKNLEDWITVKHDHNIK